MLSPVWRKEKNINQGFPNNTALWIFYPFLPCHIHNSTFINVKHGVLTFQLISSKEGCQAILQRYHWTPKPTGNTRHYKPAKKSTHIRILKTFFSKVSTKILSSTTILNININKVLSTKSAY